MPAPRRHCYILRRQPICLIKKAHGIGAISGIQVHRKCDFKLWQALKHWRVLPKRVENGYSIIVQGRPQYKKKAKIPDCRKQGKKGDNTAIIYRKSRKIHGLL